MQDYPRGFYESSWTHIEVAFNYQRTTCSLCLRLEMVLQDLCIVHFRGELKMWDRRLLLC